MSELPAQPSPDEDASTVADLPGVDPFRAFDHDKIQRAVRMIFEAIGEDPERPGIVETPARVAREYDEIFAGLLVDDPASVLSVVFDEQHDELVLMRDIPFHSTCEHHLVPFVGHAHIGYLPNTSGQVTGLSKLARLVDVCAKRPGLQERMTTMIADALERALDPRGVIVVIEARHFCMEMRGVKKTGAETVTSTVRGIFRDDPRTRAEALSLLRGDPRRT
ncbi:MAG TPA: GTP cyclohydrolase I FolE [Egicoccus sp.]|nr:GTP cyclohydrolase I FolE [Egicoccus sp.]HSK24752.1 GTP cyclohydrolase I FolE [Egicoccus sp.]